MSRNNLFSYFVTLLLILLSSTANAHQKVTIALKWLHQFQFAGIYAAKEKGFYKQAGLDVTIKERDFKSNPLEEVLNGKADFGISDSYLILERTKGRPIVLLAAIMQHSPNVLISLAKKTD